MMKVISTLMIAMFCTALSASALKEKSSSFLEKPALEKCKKKKKK